MPASPEFEPYHRWPGIPPERVVNGARSTHASLKVAPLVALLFGLSTTRLGAEPPSAEMIQVTGLDVPGMESYDRLVRQFMAKWRLPGGAVAVLKDGRLVLARGYGLADVAGKRPVEPGSLFRLASISKPITAVALLRLVEQRRLDLDAKVFDVLPRFEPKHDPRMREVTVRQLLRHTAGWDREKSFDPMFRSYLVAEEVGVEPPATSEAVIRYMLKRPLDFDPGERFAYSNFGYCLLGRVIEATTGMGYEESVRELVLAPCGIRHMRLGRTRPRERANGEVMYYDVESNEPTRSVFPDEAGEVAWPDGGFHLEAMDAHGGWIGSAPELMRFVAALERPNEEALLTPESLALMTSRPPEPVTQTEPAYYGLGWMIRSLDGGGRHWWHTGSLPGTLTLLVRTHQHISWAALFNSRPNDDPAADFRLELDQLMHQAAAEVTVWPDDDLFVSGS